MTTPDIPALVAEVKRLQTAMPCGHPGACLVNIAGFEPYCDACSEIKDWRASEAKLEAEVERLQNERLEMWNTYKRVVQESADEISRLRKEAAELWDRLHPPPSCRLCGDSTFEHECEDRPRERNPYTDLP